MKLENAAIAIRPRSLFDIIDLAIRFYRDHLGALAGCAVIFSIPAFVGGFGVFWLTRSAMWGALVMFALMPLASHAVLLVASRLVFGETIGLRQSLHLYRPLWLGMFARRLAQRALWLPLLPLLVGEAVRLGYAFDPMIILLERLTGFPGGLRRKAMNRASGFRAGPFDVAVVAVALVLVIALAFAVDLVGSDIVDIWETGGMFSDVSLSGVKVAFWQCLVIVVSPVVDLAWFFFYLDVRIRIEGWDLELGFKALAKRLGSAGRTAA